MEREREKLIALLLGDLAPEDAPALQARIAGDAALQAQRDSLERQIAAMRNLPDDDVPQAAVDRVMNAVRGFHASPEAVQLARVITLKTFVNIYLPRIAAAALFVLLVGYAVHYIPDGPAPSVGTVIAADGSSYILTNDQLVEAGIGSPVRVKLATGEILLDGGAAVRVLSNGENQQPTVQVDRGRVVVDAARAPSTVDVGGRRVVMAAGTVLSLDYDREHARIVDGGAVVEIQRTSIADVLPHASEAYGIVLDASLLPEAVKRQRVTFFGTQLDGEGFVRSFVEAAAQYGVKREGKYLLYEAGTTHRVGDTEQVEVLSLNLLQGSAQVSSGTQTLDVPASISFTHDRTITNEQRPERSCIWARGMGNAVVDGKLRDVSTGEATLPAGSVIHPDRLVLPQGTERIFVLHGPDFNFPLPGGRMGRLVGLLSSGAEFQLEGSVIRVFVPHSSVAK